MRVTAATAKGLGPGSHPRQKPETGTKSRALYDAFVEAPGIPILVRPIRDSLGVNASSFGHMMRALVDFYELDLRRIRNGLWVLAGRWDGPKYTDFIAPIVKHGKRART